MRKLGEDGTADAN